MAASNTYTVTIQANGQLYAVNVFAENSIKAADNAKNQIMGKIGNNPRFTIVSVVPFNACGVSNVIIANRNPATVSTFVASGGQSMDVG